MTIPIRLAGERIRGAITRSKTTGYFDIAYANGRYVAVGYQLGADISGGTAGDGPAVTVAGASESVDGGYTWRDVALPYLGQKQVYRKIAFGNGRWLASSLWGRSGVNQHYPAVALDRPLGTPLTFAATLATPANGFAIVGLDSSPNGFMLTGQQGAAATSVYTTNGVTFDNRPNATLPTASSNCWTGRRFLIFLNWACAGTTPNNIAGPWNLLPQPPWGVSQAQAAFCYASASDGTNAIVVTSDRFNASGAVSTPPGRFFWLTKDDGATWLRYGKMPGEETLDGLCYDKTMNLFCAVGFDRKTLSSVCLIGRPGMMNEDYTDLGGANSWVFRELPVALWSSVASDGENFVAVSQDGVRFVIDLTDDERKYFGILK
jgi:hypothetical protein